MFAVISSKQCIIIKTIIRFGFCDIQNNQSLGRCYQPRPSARLITLTSTLIIPGITKPHPIIVYNRKPQVISGWCGGGGGPSLPPPPRSAPDLVLLTYRLIILVHPSHSSPVHFYCPPPTTIAFHLSPVHRR